MQFEKTIKLIHWMSVEHNPWDKIEGGTNVFYPDEPKDKIYCVPAPLDGDWNQRNRDSRFYWGPLRHRNLMVILEVPIRLVSMSRMGWISNLGYKDDPSFNEENFLSSLISSCTNSDNALVVESVEFDVSWIKAAFFVYEDAYGQKVLEELDRDFWT